MKRRFQKNGMWKIVFSLVSMLLLLTNCQEEEMPLNEISSSIEQKILVPSVMEAQLNFEAFSSNEVSNTQAKNSKKKHQNFFVHWKKSKIYPFNERNRFKILYTPVLTSDQLKKSKTFLASIKNRKGNLKSKIFSLHYNENHTNEAFSGYLFEKDLNGYSKKIHLYKDGVRIKTYDVKKKNEASKSTLASKQDDCPPLTAEEWQWIIEMLESSGGGSYTSLDCVVVIGNNNDDPSAGENDPDYGFPPVPDKLSGGSTSSGTETRDPVPQDQWWHEETEVEDMNHEIELVLIDHLPPLTPAQSSFIKNPANANTNIRLLNFLQANGHSMESQQFAMNAIDAFIDGEEVDFDELYIETLTPDDSYNYQGATSYITTPLVLSNGDKVQIQFGTTKSDNKNANQKVSTDLIEGLKFALNEANNKLSTSEKISSLYIMATTNGSHSSTSNHVNGTAIDISRINGEKMALSGVTEQIKKLQQGFDNYKFIRENFGPYFKHKFTKENGVWNYNYPVGGHKDHIHISIRK